MKSMAQISTFVFLYTYSTIPLLISEISSFYVFSLAVQPGLCQTCLETRLFVFFSCNDSENLCYISGAALVACSILKAMSGMADDDEELELSMDLQEHAK